MKTELIEIYRQCMDQRKHYDNLSWAIGGVAVLIDSAIIKWSFDLQAEVGNILVVLFLNVIGILLMYCWYSIYERNRMFVEVANELARDIERKWGVDGVGIRNGKYSVGALKGIVKFKNIDSLGNSYADPSEEIQKDNSAHFSIRHLIMLIVSLNIFSMIQCLLNE